MKNYFLGFCICGCMLLFSSVCFSQDDRVVYKSVDTTDLFMDIYYPPHMNDESIHPAMIFFFGGGWNGGSVNQFKPHAEYFSKSGVVCFLADYRVKSRQGTTPFESVKDAKSAVRYVRRNARKYNINPDQIIASGGSAGGHLAAATAVIEGFNQEYEDTTVSCKPNALVLFNPVIDNGPGGYGFERIGDQYKDFSPLHNLHKGVPPTIIFLGTRDKLIPVETMEYYKTIMERVGSRCDLHLYEGEAHGFFNYSKRKNYNSTVMKTDDFLKSLGY